MRNDSSCSNPSTLMFSAYSRFYSQRVAKKKKNCFVHKWFRSAFQGDGSGILPIPVIPLAFVLSSRGSSYLAPPSFRSLSPSFIPFIVAPAANASASQVFFYCFLVLPRGCRQIPKLSLHKACYIGLLRQSRSHERTAPKYNSPYVK
jgi:hypothetical protein